MLDALHEDVNLISKYPLVHNVIASQWHDDSAAERAWNNALKRANSFIVQQFYGQYSQSTQCNHCNLISTLYSTYSILNLPIPPPSNPTTLNKCIENYCTKEELTGENLYACSNCNHIQEVSFLLTAYYSAAPSYIIDIIVSYYITLKEATRKINIIKVPNILIVAFKRFNSETRRKKDTNITYPVKRLNLSAITNDPSHKYDLFAVSQHHGIFKSTGHCTAFIKSILNQLWYHMDDEKIPNEILTENVVTRDAYILFYKNNEMDINVELDMNMDVDVDTEISANQCNSILQNLRDKKFGALDTKKEDLIIKTLQKI
eukprot:477551_1